MRRNRSHVLAALLLLASLAALVFWVLSRDTTDTVTFHGTGRWSLGVSADHGLMRVEKTTLTTDSDRHIRFWHGRAPIESGPGDGGFAGFGYYHVPTGSWSAAVPLWFVAVITAGLGGLFVRRRRRLRSEPPAEPAS